MTKKSTKAKETTTTKAKITTKSRYGHRLGTQAGTLDDLFFKGTTLGAAAEVNRLAPMIPYLSDCEAPGRAKPFSSSLKNISGSWAFMSRENLAIA
jgi:hypothetical protein